MIYVVDLIVSKLVTLRDFRGTDKWRSGVVFEEIGPVSYMIEAQDSSVHKHHVDHIHHREENPSVPTRSCFR